MKTFAMLVLLVFSSCTVRAQSPPQSLEENRASNYKKLFDMTDGIFKVLPKTCKTEVCAKLAAEGANVVNEGKDKHARGVLLIEEERAAWHAKLQSSLQRSITELQAELFEKYGAKVPTAALLTQSCDVKPAHLATDMCGLCYDTFENLAEICALYAFVSPEAARHTGLICLAVATLQFGGCIQAQCVWNLNTN